jgi:hypothetical protein
VRYLKVLGLSIVAVVAMTAFFGASSASAVQLCKTVNFGSGDGLCPTILDEAESSDPIFSTSTEWVLTTSATNITCENASMTVDPATSTGSPIAAEVTALSATGNCKTTGGTACTVTTVNLPYPAAFTGEGFTINDAVGGGFVVKCGFLINCTFTVKDMFAPTTHVGDDSVTHLSKISMEKAGGFCPATAEWHATFVFHGVTKI